MLRLRYDTPGHWSDLVLADLDGFLSDHAHNERKVAHTALLMARQNPRETEIVDAMIALAQEELGHFRDVHELIKARGGRLGFDGPDAYMNALLKATRKADVGGYLLDRLLAFGVVEARGCERFSMLADALPEGELKTFYQELTRCEARHHALFVRLAKGRFPAAEVDARLDELLTVEAEIVRSQPLRPTLH
ncbi:MAG: tRNA-(ms[2]io[6]A)-hydroxylase [Myxococcales bacterium]|nr:tRNA-(ms[2]io[6]A)-hydroxylase [Myxococcales bacterium]MCB9737231.1 tRNA-(ms[2]io[6]A)-hydroxylase [Deltaproteobacteria bacterium]